MGEGWLKGEDRGTQENNSLFLYLSCMESVFPGKTCFLHACKMEQKRGGKKHVQTVHPVARLDQWPVGHGTLWTKHNGFEVLELSAKSPPFVL